MIREPYIFVMCDVCEDEEDFEMTALSGLSWDCRNLERDMQRQGWLIDGGGGRHTCPDCATEARAA